MHYIQECMGSVSREKGKCKKEWKGSARNLEELYNSSNQYLPNGHGQCIMVENYEWIIRSI